MKYLRFIKHKWRRLLIEFGLLASIIAVIGGMISLLFLFASKTYEIRGPRLNEIENVIAVREGENKFTEFRRIAFGGAGAGGLGAPQIYAQTADQFADLVPQGEPIYTWWEDLNTGWPKQVYWAFIENRAGLLIWETEYRPGTMRYSCRFQYMTETELVFKTNTSVTSCGPKNGPGSRGLWVRIGEWVD